MAVNSILCFIFYLSIGPVRTSGKSFTNEGVEMGILYGYVIDMDSPNYLARGDRIFNISRDDDLSISPNAEVTVDYEYSDSVHKIDKIIAKQFDVEGCFGAFSAAANMQVSRTTNPTIKTIRVDSFVTATKYEVSSIDEFHLFPEKFLTENFRNAVKVLSNKDIEERIGVFYVTKLMLGGKIKKSYTMQATEYDTETNVLQELRASFGKGLMGVSSKVSVGVTNRSVYSHSKMRIQWAAQGGDTEIWLGKDFSDSKLSVEDTVKNWAGSIDESNLYPSELQLRPLYELVKKVDLNKGREFEKYLKDKWNTNAKAFHPTIFLKTEPLIFRLTQSDWIKKRCNEYCDWCKKEAKWAQYWIDKWYTKTSSKRYENWRLAARQGKDEMTEIIEMVRNPKLTVHEFKNDLAIKANNRDIRSKSDFGPHWTPGIGYNSELSNKVEAKTRDVIKSLIEKISEIDEQQMQSRI